MSLLDTITVISKELTKESQDVFFNTIVNCNGFRLNINICSNVYASQCYARVSVWSATTMQWNKIYHIPHSAMNTGQKLSYEKSCNENHFKRDRDTLITVAIKILGVEE